MPRHLISDAHEWMNEILGASEGDSRRLRDLRAQGAAYQQLRGAEDIQGEGLDAGVMHTQLPMDAGALDARQDAQVGGEPRGIWREKAARGSASPPSPMRCSNCPPWVPDPHPGRGDTLCPDLPGAPQSQHCLFPGMFFTSLMTSLVSSCTPPSAPPPAAAPPPLGSPLKALLRASSLLFCSTETHLGGGKGTPGEEEEDGEGGAGSGTAQGDGCSAGWGRAVTLTQRTPARPPLGNDTSCCLQGRGGTQ